MWLRMIVEKSEKAKIKVASDIEGEDEDDKQIG